MTTTRAHPYDSAETSEITKQQEYHEHEGDAVVATAVVNENPSVPLYSPTGVAASTTATNPVTVVPAHHSKNYVWIDTRKPVTLSHCPRCSKSNVATTTRTKITGATWLGVAVGFFIVWPLCWIPLVVKPMKQTNHYCTSCNAKIGRVKAFH